MEKKAIERYRRLADTPSDALREIKSGRIKGKFDINPQWRIEQMTAEYGQCGVGWRFEVTNKEFITVVEGQIVAIVDILLYTREEEKWSEPIPGTGGSMLVAKEHSGLYVSDEAYKMALTDALSVAMKLLGVAGDVYRGKKDGVPPQEKTKYDRSILAKGKEKDEQLPWLNKDTKTADGKSAYAGAEKWMKEGGDIEKVKQRFRLSKAIEKDLLNITPKTS